MAESIGRFSRDPVLEEFSRKHQGYGVIVETETPSGDRYATMKNVRLESIAPNHQGFITIAVKDQAGGERSYTMTGNWHASGTRDPHTIEFTGPGGKTIVHCSPPTRGRKRVSPQPAEQAATPPRP